MIEKMELRKDRIPAKMYEAVEMIRFKGEPRSKDRHLKTNDRHKKRIGGGKVPRFACSFCNKGFTYLAAYQKHVIENKAEVQVVNRTYFTKCMGRRRNILCI